MNDETTLPKTIVPACLASSTAPEITAWPYEFPLSRVVQAHGDDTKVLVLSEPSGEHIFKFGLLHGLHPSNAKDLIVALAGVPGSTLDKMAGADLMALSTRLGRFFNQAAA